MNNKKQKLPNNPQKSKIVPEIDRQIKSFEDKSQLSIKEALDRIDAIKNLVSKTAVELEIEGDLEGSAELYEKIIEAYNLASERVPQAYKKLVDSSANFWKSISEAKRDSYKTSEPEPCESEPKPEPLQLARRLGLGISQPSSGQVAFHTVLSRISPARLGVSPLVKKANFYSIHGTASSHEEKNKTTFGKESFVRGKPVVQIPYWTQTGESSPGLSEKAISRAWLNKQ